MAVTVEITTQQDSDVLKPHTSIRHSNGTWDTMVADYYHRGIAGASFRMISEDEFEFITSNNTKCRFVRKADQ